MTLIDTLVSLIKIKTRLCMSVV